MNVALMFIISNKYERNCFSDLLQLELCNDKYKEISEIMRHCYDMSNTFNIAINFCNAKKMKVALMFIISNHYISNLFGRKCLSDPLHSEPSNDMLKVISEKKDIAMIDWYDL